MSLLLIGWKIPELKVITAGTYKKKESAILGRLQ
jgi:hypothetical protein